MSNYFQVLKRIEKDRADKTAGADVIPAPAREASPETETRPVSEARQAPEARHTSETRPAPDTHPTPARSLRALSSSGAPSESPGEAREVSTRPVPPRHSVTSLQSMTPPASPRAAEPVARTPEPMVRTSEPAPRVETPSARARTKGTLSPESERGITTLLGKIRASASGQVARTLVFAGAAPSDSVHTVSDGLARHAERHGMHVLVAEFVQREGATLLVAAGPVERDDERVRTIDLNRADAAAELKGWVQRVAGRRDLVILEGPPLAESIDSALLACACDGLVIIADAEVTPRAALHAAAERAQIAGCQTLGVVMSGTKERLPIWMRRFMGTEGT